MAGELTNKQRVFVEEYLRCWNGAEAARRAQYKNPRQSATENLSKPYIKTLIEQRIKEKAMSADEVLAHLADIARFDAGLLLGRAGVIDWDEAKEQGQTQFVKKLKWTSDGLEVECYDRMDALELIGKNQAMWIDRRKYEGTGDDGELIIRVVYGNGTDSTAS